MASHPPLPGAVQASLARLEADLMVEAAELDRLDEVLHRERDALAGGLDEAIAAIAGEKERHARALAQLAERRLATLLHAGRRVRMDEFVEQGPAGEGLRSVWHRVREKAREVHALNLANGRLIALHLRNVQGRLAALVAVADPSQTYGPGGASVLPGQRASIAVPGRALGAA